MSDDQEIGTYQTHLREIAETLGIEYLPGCDHAALTNSIRNRIGVLRENEEAIRMLGELLASDDPLKIVASDESVFIDRRNCELGSSADGLVHAIKNAHSAFKAAG